MDQKTTLPKWKLYIYPAVTFIVVFGVSRSLFPLFKNWTWLATLGGLVCGGAASVLQLVLLFLQRSSRTKNH